METSPSALYCSFLQSRTSLSLTRCLFDHSDLFPQRGRPHPHFPNVIFLLMSRNGIDEPWGTHSFVCIGSLTIKERIGGSCHAVKRRNFVKQHQK